VHQLRRALHGGRVAPERGRRQPEVAAISGAHALLTHIVLAWDTRRMDGAGIEEVWLRRIGPSRWSYIRVRGTFRFNVEAVRGRAGRARRRAGHNQIWPMRATAMCLRPACRRWDSQLTFSGD
jgi:hypothetical protein